MKPPLKPAALTQPPEKPLNFTQSRLIHFLRGGVLIVASVSDFDYRSELFQPGGVSEAEWCKNPSPPHPLWQKRLFSLPLAFSAILSSVPPLFQAARLVLGANCFSQHKSPRRKMEKKDMGREKGESQEEEKNRDLPHAHNANYPHAGIFIHVRLFKWFQVALSPHAYKWEQTIPADMKGSVLTTARESTKATCNLAKDLSPPPSSFFFHLPDIWSEECWPINNSVITEAACLLQTRLTWKLPSGHWCRHQGRFSKAMTQSDTFQWSNMLSSPSALTNYMHTTQHACPTIY